MLTEKDYCDYETCVSLREFGYNAPQRLIPDYFGVFDEPQYDERIHLYDAQKWLRENKNISISVMPSPFGYFASIYINFKRDESSTNTKYTWDTVLHPSNDSDNYEEALLNAIKYTIIYLD